MTSSEKKNKRNGLIGTVLFHVLLVVTFLFLGLTYRIPPPPEEGISIDFGFSDHAKSLSRGRKHFKTYYIYYKVYQ